MCRVARMAIADNWNAAPVTAQMITANVTCGQPIGRNDAAFRLPERKSRITRSRVA
jgi:hypothetical protein